MKAVGDQVSPIKSLLFISTITTIINFNFSVLPSDSIFLYKHSYMESQDHPFMYHQPKSSDG